MKLVAVIVLSILSIAEGLCIIHQSKIINTLIDLNHDKSLYIDGGCRGQYQGTEEMLSGEAVLQ